MNTAEPERSKLMKMVLILGLVEWISWIMGTVLDEVRPVRKRLLGLLWASAMAVAALMPPTLVPVMTLGCVSSKVEGRRTRTRRGVGKVSLQSGQRKLWLLLLPLCVDGTPLFSENASSL